MDSPYAGREQTAAKHFVLKRYLQALSNKILLGGRSSELSYVDGFSGPWNSNTENFSDTSFMIAINALKATHLKVREVKPNISTRCLFIERSKKSHAALNQAVADLSDPENRFFIKTHCGAFEDSSDVVTSYIRNSFALVFIDPTGWTGYAYKKIEPILRHPSCEVLINFMYDHINRATSMNNRKTIASFDAILGGPGWKDRLGDGHVGAQAERLFREELKRCGHFKYVVSTHIRKTHADRTHFAIAYGTRNYHGLSTFRDVEHDAQREHHRLRMEAYREQNIAKVGQGFLFEAIAFDEPLLQAAALRRSESAYIWIGDFLRDRGRPILFEELAGKAMEIFSVRETDVKTIVARLASEGLIESSWKVRNPRARKPNLGDRITLASAAPGSAV